MLLKKISKIKNSYELRVLLRFCNNFSKRYTEHCTKNAVQLLHKSRKKGFNEI